MKKIFEISNDYADARLDRWFKKNISEVPQSLIEKNIRKGKIKVNNKKEKSSYRLKNKDKIAIYNINFSPNKQKKVIKKYIATRKDLSKSSNIFIENNENFAVVNKPAGIAVQMGTKSRNLSNVISQE